MKRGWNMEMIGVSSEFNPWPLWFPVFGVTCPPHGCLNATVCNTLQHFLHFVFVSSLAELHTLH